jgi:hypothetical protein
MVKYTCDTCDEVFAQKRHLADQKARKRPCRKDNTIEALVERKVEAALSITSTGVEHVETSTTTPAPLHQMDHSTKTREELITIYKGRCIEGYSGKKKEAILDLLRDNDRTPDDPTQMVVDMTNQETSKQETTNQDTTNQETTNKKNRGQFYTTNAAYILDGLPLPPPDVRCIVEPFAGKGDLMEWLRKSGCTLEVDAYDIDPKSTHIQERDTLTNPPDYANAWVVTNPPYLARNKSTDKSVFDLYDTNDLYKCFITSVVRQNNCRGGIFIIPAGFFFSPRDIDVRCRDAFLRTHRITKVKYFEETVFDDTTTTIVAVAFEKSAVDLEEQDVEWVIMPSNVRRVFKMASSHKWIIGGDIYSLSMPDHISVRRYIEGQALRTNEQQLHITLSALDSGTKDGRIRLAYKAGYLYPAKECSRTYASLRITGRTLTESEQIQLCHEFNAFIEQKRDESWSLFLPQFRESKEYARKRMPFELAYRIVLHMIHRRTLAETSQSTP